MWLRQKSGLIIMLAGIMVLSGCSEVNLLSYGAKKYRSSGSPQETDTADGGIDRGQPKIGKPYQIDGVWYYPAADTGYDETGIASWYGEPFHGRPTANGAIYDMNKLTAAHKTLPLPSDVRVTNLENGRSIVVTVNDRGPFAHSRIIDLSYGSAKLLGIIEKGTAKVRVQIVNGNGADGTQMVAKPDTPDNERNNVAAAPRATIVADSLAPPSNVKSAPAPRNTALPAPKAEPSVQMASYNTAQPVVTVSPVTDSEIFIQAGAFVDYNNANVLSASLSNLGPSKVSQALVNGQDFYRVRVGPVTDIARADQVLESLINTGHKDARIIVE